MGLGPAQLCFEGLGLRVKWEFSNVRRTLFWALIRRTLLFRVLYQGPLFSETPKCDGVKCQRSRLGGSAEGLRIRVKSVQAVQLKLKMV